MTEADKHESLLSAASSISDGDAVDWAELRRRVGDELDTAVLAELEVLDGIARVHRTEWGNLDIVEPIGHGAFGTVFRAFDRDLHRDVALKVTRQLPGSAGFDPERLVQEARRLARVKHPNVVSVFTAERKGNEVGVVMDWIKGQTLEAIVTSQGPLGAREVALIGIDVCRALAAVHSAGLLHGDIKANNVMREEGGRIVLMDFGTSRDLARQPLGNDFAGTPLYIAPEVFAGAPRSTASDVYSLGVLLCFLATGAYPVDGDTRSALDRQHAQVGTRRHLRDIRADLPDGFIRVVERAMAEQPTDRYATAGSLEAALTAFLGHQAAPVSPWRGRTFIALAAGVILIAILAAFAFRDRGSDTTSAATQDTPTNTVSVATPVPYDVEAAVYRVDNGGPVRVAAGDPVRPGNRLFLQVHASVPVHVYVVNEDDEGRAYLLFPLKGYSQQNPLPAGLVHNLPGTRDDIEHYWQATSQGGREHLMIFVSPTPMTEFDRTFAELPRASEDAPVVATALGPNALSFLRGIGGIAAATTPRVDQPLHEQYRTPLPAASETTSGVWVRQVTFASAP